MEIVTSNDPLQCLCLVQNIINENVAFLLVILHGKELRKLISAVRFGSKALEMTIVENCMYLTKLCEALACQCM